MKVCSSDMASALLFFTGALFIQNGARKIHTHHPRGMGLWRTLDHPSIVPVTLHLEVNLFWLYAHKKQSIDGNEVRHGHSSSYLRQDTSHGWLSLPRADAMGGKACLHKLGSEEQHCSLALGWNVCCSVILKCDMYSILLFPSLYFCFLHLFVIYLSILYFSH
ncbi:hypothetical protein E2C01_040625 [Portunus trituberculatus]|uniref:Uncharacterized protein n=1 Tax=Portunus trituberculatus TaxID=210409 RepID=A0A5B7FRA1_PORTR|nr:hypothetical protein [Portunus trituberculatus]